jgi:hypothetical protein
MPVILILLVVMVAFALVGFRLFNSLRTMQIQLGFGAVLLRYESPSLFWLALALQCLGLGTLFSIIYVLCFVAPYQPMM